VQVNDSNNLFLVSASSEYKNQIVEFLDECQMAGEPIISFVKDDFNFDFFCQWIEHRSNTTKEGCVPATMLFVLDMKRNKIIGVVDIRHYLNERSLHHGGHIGNIVRPSERRKGIGTQQIKLALVKSKELGIDRVLITCDQYNIGSAKTILRNGGILENEVEFECKVYQRYWINLTEGVG
jgi:predicted acetyltransferase